MTRFVTMTVQVRPHGESVELDGHKFTSPEELWQHLHGRAAKVAKKPQGVINSLFITEEQAAAWAQAFAQGDGVIYTTPPGGKAITRCLPGRGLDTSHQSITHTTVEELGL